MPLRPLTPEEAARAAAKGIQVDANTMVDDPGAAEIPSSAMPAKDTGGLVGMAGRSIAANAIPAAVGGVGAGAASGFLLGAGAGPIGAGLGALIGGGTAAYGAKKAQDALLRKDVARNPNSIFAEHVANTDRDVAEHPYLTTAMSLPSAVFAGGSVVPSVANLVKNPKMAAGLAGIAGGQDIAMQQIAHPGELDIGQAAIATLGGPLFAGSGRNAPPSSAMSREAVSTRLGQLSKRAPEATPMAQRPGMDIAKLLATSPEGLKTIAGRGTGEANFYRTLARLKEQEIPLTEAEVQQLMTEGPGKGYENVARDILKAKVPDIDIAAQRTAANEEAYQGRLEASKREGTVSQVPEAEARITSITDEGISQPPSTGQAARSAEAILAAEPKIVETDLAGIKRAARILGQLERQAKDYPEGSAERIMMERVIGQMERELDAQGVELFSQRSSAEAPLPPKPTPAPKPAAPVVRIPPQAAAVVEPKPPSPPVVAVPPAKPPAVAAAEVPATAAGVPLTVAAPKTGKSKKVDPASEQPAGGTTSAAQELPAGIPKSVISKANPIQALRNLVSPTLSRLTSATGKRFAKAAEAMNIEYSQLTEPRMAKLFAAQRGLSDASRLKIGEYLKDLNDTGSSKVVLTPEEAAGAKALQELILETGVEKRDAGPLLNAYDPAGRPLRRPSEIKPNYFPGVKSKEFQELLSNPDRNPARADALRQEFVDYVVSKTNLSPEEALNLYNNQKQVVIGPSAPNARFRALRYEEGIGLPRGAQEPDPFIAMRNYLNRHGLDIAFYKNIESDPVLMKALGEDVYGRDVQLPDVVKTKEGYTVRKGELEGNENVRAALADYVGYFDKTAQNFEKVQGLIHAGRIGPLSQARNIVQNLGTLPEILHPAEYKYVIEGVAKMFSAEAESAAINAGSVRAKRNILPTVAQDLTGWVAKLQDAIGKYTGAELLAKANDVMLDGVSRNVAKNRILQGDVKFIEKFGPPDWQNKTVDQVVDYIAASMTRQFSGAYNATDLPPAMLKGSNAQFAPLFKLARWSVGRFNRWYENSYLEATKGNIEPLLTSLAGGMLSAGVINGMVELLTNMKPKELKWEEFLKLGDKDAAYTVFSKAATASYAGLLGDLIFSGLQISKGEIPRTYNNLVFQAVSDVLTRVGQFGQALASGSASLEDLGALGFETLKDQFQVLRLFDPRENEGNREEKIAARLGYIPKKGSITAALSNPISAEGAYRRKDVGRLERIIKSDIEQGKRPSAPDSEVRRTRGRVDGTYKTYYDFIAESQGEAAAEAARKRDIERTRGKRKMFGEAVRKVREE